MRFGDLIARADDDALQALVGNDALRTLRLLDPSLTTPSNLRRVLLTMRSPLELVREASSRAALLELLPVDAAVDLATRLGGSGEQPYDFLRSMTPARGSAQEELLLSWLEIAPPDDPPKQTPVSTMSEPSYPLFPHQRDALRRCESALATGRQRVLLHMPTGSGKTRTTMNLIADWLRRSEPTLVIWLAYSEELCAQAADEFEAAWDKLGNREVGVFRFWADATLDVEQCRDGIVIAGLAKTYARARRELTFLSKLSDRASLVVIDEAHQAVAETYEFVLSTLTERRKGVGLLGLTATPGRSWNDLDADEKLARFFDRSKVSLEVAGFANPVEYLISEGYLARPTFVSLPYTGTEISPAEMSRVASDLDIPVSVLKRIAADDQRNLIVVRAVESLLSRHKRVLVFAATVGHAETLATVLAARGHMANAVTATTSSSARRQIIDEFRDDGGPPRVLCNFGVLTTGFDAPSTSAAVIARPTLSLVLYSQMVGRATRGPRAGGNPEAEIHTVVDTALPGFGKISDAFFNWEDVWKETKS